MLQPCPCSPDQFYHTCCAPYHQGIQSVPTAEALMRSRYSAYVLNDVGYLFKSWSQLTRPTKTSLQQDQSSQWLGLEIIRTERGSSSDVEGVVEFVARYRAGMGESQLHEVSRFIREKGRWVYLDGDY